MNTSFCHRLSLLVILLLSLSAPAAAQGKWITSIRTDSVRYAPGTSVQFNIGYTSPDSAATMRFTIFHGDEVLSEWTSRLAGGIGIISPWVTPKVDRRGYLARASIMVRGEVLEEATFGIDVSSDWRAFPRYGFLSKFPLLPFSEMNRVVRRMNRFHLTGIQFYDWQYKHHRPLKGSPEHPDSVWPDIARRETHLSTIREYIDALHSTGIMAMSYNLLYGAYGDAQDDGVDTLRWGLYRRPDATGRYMYALPPAWASDILFMNPADTAWQRYIIAEEAKVFRALPFDGWHVDQVGDPGPLFDWTGRPVTVSDGFAPLLTRARRELNLPLVMNAVNQYGQEQIARAPVDFLYTEVWDCATTYGGLQRVIDQNTAFSHGKLRSVLAAYMNYGLSDVPGAFNLPGVLLTDAVIMASGGAHIELGEHMLVHEYFPNDRRTIGPDLEKRLASYYDFSVAYEHLLRGADVRPLPPVPAGDSLLLSSTEKPDRVWSFARAAGSSEVWHFINLRGVHDLEWRDRNAERAAPAVVSDLSLVLPAKRPVRRVWTASPDLNGGVPVRLAHTLHEHRLSVTLPRLEYWGMVVVEYADE